MISSPRRFAFGGFFCWLNAMGKRAVTLETAMLERIGLMAHIPPGHIEYERIGDAFKNLTARNDKELAALRFEPVADLLEEIFGDARALEQEITETAITDTDVNRVLIALETMMLSSSRKLRETRVPRPDLAESVGHYQVAQRAIGSWQSGLRKRVAPHSEQPIRFVCRAESVQGETAVVQKQTYAGLYMGDWSSNYSDRTEFTLHRMHLDFVLNKAFRWA